LYPITRKETNCALGAAAKLAHRQKEGYQRSIRIKLRARVQIITMQRQKEATVARESVVNTTKAKVDRLEF